MSAGMNRRTGRSTGFTVLPEFQMRIVVVRRKVIDALLGVIMMLIVILW